VIAGEVPRTNQAVKRRDTAAAKQAATQGVILGG
jgi:hypothetical protein